MGNWRVMVRFLLLLAWVPGAVQSDVSVGPDGALDAVLVLRSAGPADRFLGSGFIWGRVGDLALTNAHVVGAATEVTIIHRDGHRETAPVIARDDARDIALIRLSGRAPGITVRDGPPTIGTEVFALGAPLDASFTVTRGIISADPRQVEANVPLRLIQHDAAINPGSSGGPLVDGDGRLVGMNSRIADGSRLFVGIGFAIAATDLERLVPALLAGELAPVAELGLDLRPVDAVIARALNVPRTGLLLDHVAADGAAARAGLRAGDILLQMGMYRLERPGDLAFAIEAEAPAAMLRLSRAGGALELPLELVPPPVMMPTLADRAPLTLAALGLRFDGDGAVTETGAGGAGIGLVSGDRVVALNGRPLSDIDPGEEALTAPFVLLVQREERYLHIVADPWSDAQAHIPLGGNRLDSSVVRF